MTIPDSAPPGTPPPQETPPTQRSKRPVPAWVYAIPLAALTGLGGYYLGQPSANSSTSQAGQMGAGGPPGQSASGQGASGQGTTGSSSGQGAGTGRRSSTGSTAGGTGTGSWSGGAGTGARRGSTAVVAVTATPVKSGTLTTQRTAAGTVAAAKSTSVVARNSGTVTEVNTSVGQSVTAGQVLVKLSNPDLNASVASARNALESAQAQLSSQQVTLQTSRTQLQAAVKAAQLSLQNAQQTYSASQQLYAAGALSRSDLNTQAVAVQNAQSSLAAAQTNLAQNAVSQQSGIRDLQLSVDKARIALSQAQQQADTVTITAPYDGQVTAVSAVGGQYLSAGNAVLTLVSSERQLSFNVPPSDAAAFVPGRQLSFAAGQKTYTVKVSNNPGSASSGVVAITARFVGDIPASGTVGTVSYSSTVGNGILIPTTALQTDNDKVSVFTVQGGKAKLQNITVIGQTGDTAVVSGLEAGTQVIATPPAGLLDGVKVDTTGAGKAGGRSGAPAGGPGGPP